MMWFLITFFVFGFLCQAADYKPLNSLIIKYTGKSPHDWGYIAGVKTRHFFTGDSHD
jgi:hypothetical protein